MNRYIKVREENGGDGRTRWTPVDEICPPVSGSALINDPDPTLAADLKLNNRGLIGQLDDETLIIDGGLI